MKNKILFKFSIVAMLPIFVGCSSLYSFLDYFKNGNENNESKENNDDDDENQSYSEDDPHLVYYTKSKLPKSIDLNDASAETIRYYYADLNGKNLRGDNLLGALKPILSNGQKYFSYESNDAIWYAYEITDRDWEKSPASEIASYDASTNTIKNYVYKQSTNYADKENPYIRALYVDRNFDNPMKAWSKNLGSNNGDNPKGYYAHSQKWGGFNQEHIWAKSHGFDSEGKGGARGDLMHLWPGDGRANLLHNNYNFGYVKKTSSSAEHVTFEGISDAENYAINNWLGPSLTLGSQSSNLVFEPQDSDKGDIARAIFYMCARYNHIADDNWINTDEPWLIISDNIDTEKAGYTSSKNRKGVMGVMSDLLEWNRLDPVDDYEIHRNNILFNSFTMNRNPFIDFPSWADIIWGSEGGYANPAIDPISLFGQSNSLIRE